MTVGALRKTQMTLMEHRSLSKEEETLDFYMSTKNVHIIEIEIECLQNGNICPSLSSILEKIKGITIWNKKPLYIIDEIERYIYKGEVICHELYRHCEDNNYQYIVLFIPLKCATNDSRLIIKTGKDPSFLDQYMLNVYLWEY